MQCTVLLWQFWLSVCQMRVLWQNGIITCQYLNPVRTRDISTISTPMGDCWELSHSTQNIAESDPPPFEKCRLRQISAYNISTVTDSAKSSIMTSIKSTMGFPTSYRWNAFITPKPRNGWLRKRSFLKYKSTSIE